MRRPTTPRTTGRNLRSDGVPKPKPDKVVRHEIVFGRTAQDTLDMVGSAYTANRVMTPLIDLAKAAADPKTLAIITLAWYHFFGRPDMEGADPLLFAAITGSPTDYFNNFSLWYMTRRKQRIEEAEDPAAQQAQYEQVEKLMLGMLPGIGPIFKF